MSKNKFIYALVCAVLLFQASLVNADIETAHADYLAENYLAAYTEYLKLAKSSDGDDTEAQYNLAMMYSKGIGVTQDLEQAVYWYRKAAEQKHAEAQLILAVIYTQGLKRIGVTQDLKKAVYWARKAAEQKHAEAQLILGWLYYSGQGVTKDFDQAFYWYREAAEQKLAKAQHSLGLLYFKGQGVTKNFEQAFYWFIQAANQGHVKSQFTLAVAFDLIRTAGDGKSLGLDPVDFYLRAVYWYRKAAEQGHAKAISTLADLKKEQIEKLANKLFDNIFWIKFQGYEMIKDLENLKDLEKPIDTSKEKDLSETIELRGKRLVKKIWIKVKIQLNNDGSYKLDKEGNIISCKVIDKSQNLLDKYNLDEEGNIDADCSIKPEIKKTWLDKFIDYAW